MRNLATLVAGLLLCSTLQAQTNNNKLEHIPVAQMPSFDLEKVLKEDANDKMGNQAPRFAYTHTVQLDTNNSGLWETEKDMSIWRLRILSKEAKSINLGFTTFHLPKTANLSVYSLDKKNFRGPFTELHNNSAKQLWTPVVTGEQIIVELRVSTKEKAAVQLKLTEVNHDYLGFGRNDSLRVKSGACNVDVVCPEGNMHNAQIRSVAVISMNGRRFCSGAMVNNAANDGKPYFLTAHHCGVRSQNAATLVAYWNFENQECRTPNSPNGGGRGNGNLEQFSTGAELRATLFNSDFTLVEFFQAPDPQYRVYYSGWDRRDEAPTESVAIHHPDVNEKRISFANSAGRISSYLDRGSETTHIKVIDWNLGTTEPGSSGSPLFNQDKRIVGQLHGGYAACGNDDADWYGRITSSWDNGQNSNSLKPWLDPENTGIEYIDGIEQP